MLVTVHSCFLFFVLVVVFVPVVVLLLLVVGGGTPFKRPWASKRRLPRHPRHPSGTSQTHSLHLHHLMVLHQHNWLHFIGGHEVGYTCNNNMVIVGTSHRWHKIVIVSTTLSPFKIKHCHRSYNNATVITTWSEPQRCHPRVTTRFKLARLRAGFHSSLHVVWLRQGLLAFGQIPDIWSRDAMIVDM